MIIDGFIFFNELDMLEFRLEEMYDYVDYFILVESNMTFSGKQKKLFFDENKKRYEKYLNKIIHIKSELPEKIKFRSAKDLYEFLNEPLYPNISRIEELINFSLTKGGSVECWIREYLQRNDISKGLEILNPKDDDVVIISDVDEIIDTNFLKEIINKDEKTGLVNTTTGGHSLWLKWYSYNLECSYHANNNKMVICNYGRLKEIGDCNSARWSEVLPVRGTCGWHFSYFGNVEYIKYKIDSFAHQEYNLPEFTNDEKIESKIKNNLDLFDRDDNGNLRWYNYVPFEKESYWPKKIMFLKELFKL